MFLTNYLLQPGPAMKSPLKTSPLAGLLSFELQEKATSE